MRSARSLVLAGLVPLLALSACNRSDDGSGELGASVDKLATPGAAAPQAAPVEPGTYTDPQASSCGAPEAASFVGQPDSPEIREQLTAAAKAPGGVRFVRPGEATTDDYRPDCLNVMIDVTGVIRDLRCG